ncbi:MAG: metallophosphoesterase family protein, partial [Kiritimatiellae bacterium]|nr:metallophosphoesterase family protein [Kiritimatiellia bacterium]
MIYAVISDIHANESALRKVLEDARAHGAQRIVCLGDIVGYGPLPSETLNLLLSQNATIIAGNHDDAVSGRVDEDDFIDLARDAVLRHREMLPPKSRDILSSLPYTIAFGEAVAAHGDFTEPEKFNYIESEEDAAINFSSINSRLAFVGHTHVPGIYLTGQSGAVYIIDPQDFTVEDGKRYIVNPGSVGYPRVKDGKCFSSYVLYDSDERTVTFRF